MKVTLPSRLVLSFFTLTLAFGTCFAHAEITQGLPASAVGNSFQGDQVHATFLPALRQALMPVVATAEVPAPVVTATMMSQVTRASEHGRKLWRGLSFSRQKLSLVERHPRRSSESESLVQAAQGMEQAPSALGQSE